MKKLVTFFALLAILYPSIIGRSTQIPSYLLGCYRKNVSELMRNLQVPLTSQVLVELVRNVEINLETVLDMRTMSSSMLHSLKFDGIQRASNVNEKADMVPVGPTSMHFSMYKLLVDYLLPGEGALFPMDTLTMKEMCTLHYMLSSSVQAWERGDESTTCPKDISIINKSKYPISYIQGKQKSVCPIERGVIKSIWGDVSPGRLLTGIVAALYKQDVKLDRLIQALSIDEEIPINNNTNKPRNTDEKINNVWAATIAGDLAEVVVYQGVYVEKLILGPTGVWNDSMLPRNYHLPNSIGSHWEMTSAETLGGIDGVLIASMVNEWTRIMGSLRLSQLIDMYYSRKGIAFDPNYRACQRRQKFQDLLETVDLTAETANIAKLLTYSHVAYRTEDFLPQTNEKIEETTAIVIKEFKKYLEELTDMYLDCEKGYETSPMDILTVMDGTWNEYEGRRLVAGLAHVTDISFYGSKMAFISGTTGRWLTNMTDKIFNLYEDLSRPGVESESWPTSFSLTKSLETVTKYLQNKTDKECTDKLRSTRPTVVLVLSNTATPNDPDLETSQSLITTIKSMNPGTAIVYVTSEHNFDTYNELSKNIYMNDVAIKTDRNIEMVSQGVYDKLKNIPRQIMELHCGITHLEYEDYVTPGQITTYEIPYNFLQTTNDIKVEFVGNDYGDLSICGGDKETSEKFTCQGISGHDTVKFIPKQMCSQEHACAVQFHATVTNIKYKCSEDDCRYPDQVRIKIRTSWTSSSVLIKANATFIMLTYLAFYITF